MANELEVLGNSSDNTPNNQIDDESLAAENLSRYDAGNTDDVLDAEDAEVVEEPSVTPETDIEDVEEIEEPEIEPEIVLPEFEEEDLENVATVSVLNPEDDEQQKIEAAIQADIDRQEEKKKQRQLEEEAELELPNAQHIEIDNESDLEVRTSKIANKTIGLTVEEQQQLKERVLGRTDAVDGGDVEIYLKDGSQIMDMKTEIGGSLVDFVGYKDKGGSRKMDADTALVIVLTAKDKGWDSINVHGSKQSKNMLAQVAMEHGLEVSNYKLPEAEVKSKFEGEAPGAPAVDEPAPAMESEVVDVPSNVALPETPVVSVAAPVDNLVENEPISMEPETLAEKVPELGVSTSYTKLPAPQEESVDNEDSVKKLVGPEQAKLPAPPEESKYAVKSLPAVLPEDKKEQSSPAIKRLAAPAV